MIDSKEFSAIKADPSNNDLRGIDGILKDFMSDQDSEGEDYGGGYFEEKVTMERWARTQRQKILRDISFESGSPFNIYDPHFTSDEDEDSFEMKEEEEVKSES